MRHAPLPRIAVAMAVLFVLSMLVTANPEPHHSGRSLQSHWDLIRDAVVRDILTAEQGLVYSAVALFAPDRLPESLWGARLEKCGTPILVELDARWWSLSNWARSTLSAWPVAAGARSLTRAESRPVLSGNEQTLSTPHFLVHYTLAGADAVLNIDTNTNGVPDYVDTLAQTLEDSRTAEVDLLGWTEAPSDTIVDPDSPSYDVYIQQLPVQGLTFPEIITGDNEHSPDVVEPFARCSYIILHSQLQMDVLQVTAAHEYHHAIQFGYNAAAEGFDARRWLMEGTATWMEDQVYDDVDDNVGYLPRLLAAPDRSLTHPENYYASWLFFQYLEEHLGGRDVVRSIWENSIPLTGDFSTLVIRQALQAVVSDLRSAFTAFCVSNLLLLPCELSPGTFCYDDALLYRYWAGSPFVEGSITLAEGETVYIPPDGVQPLACDAVKVNSSASAIAAGGYAGTDDADIQGIWVGRSGFSVDTLAFPIISNPEPPSASVSPRLYDTLHIVVANLIDPTDSPLSAAGYGLMLSASEIPTPTSTYTAVPTPSPTPTTTTLRRLWLPVILR